MNQTKSTRTKSTRKTKTGTVRSKSGNPRWVKHVAETSNAMDLENGLFKRSPKQIAEGLKKSVMASDRTKGTKFQSAMSMLNFYENRGGKNLSQATKERLEKAKPELRKVFGREEEKPTKKSRST